MSPQCSQTPPQGREGWWCSTSAEHWKPWGARKIPEVWALPRKGSDSTGLAYSWESGLFKDAWVILMGKVENFSPIVSHCHSLSSSGSQTLGSLLCSHSAWRLLCQFKPRQRGGGRSSSHLRLKPSPLNRSLDFHIKAQDFYLSWQKNIYFFFYFWPYW